VTEQQLMAIYQDTVHPLYRYMAKRTGGNRELTEDIVQESFLRALASWRTGAPPGSPLAWLKRVARNILIDALRRTKGERKHRADLEPAADGPPAADPFESLELFLAIASLGRKKARVIEAFYYDGLSVKEIAAEMAISARAVEGYLRRARQALRSLLPESKTDGGEHDQER
jgi:RNA polymerase sigma-70 factor (ECF subfamily)